MSDDLLARIAASAKKQDKKETTRKRRRPNAECLADETKALREADTHVIQRAALQTILRNITEEENEDGSTMRWSSGAVDVAACVLEEAIGAKVAKLARLSRRLGRKKLDGEMLLEAVV